MTDLEVREAVSSYGVAARAKLSNPMVAGAPEDQLRSPLERLIKDLAVVVGFGPNAVVVVGETALKDLQTRPDYAVTTNNALIGFVEVKAPGKGADPGVSRPSRQGPVGQAPGLTEPRVHGRKQFQPLADW